jgi:formimidoylglutamate deiminase
MSDKGAPAVSGRRGMAERQIIHPELVWTGKKFERGLQIPIEPDGTIGTISQAKARTPLWRDRAVLPGMINVHSHAFQRGLRGRGERFPRGGGSFWTWREAMYELVGNIDRDLLYAHSLQAFREMLDAGITTVGEFHYLHHDASGAGYALDEVVLRAAADAGIRLVLIVSYYKTGGIGQPLSGAQLRFRTETPAEYWQHVDRLAGLVNPATQSLAAAAHSIRAVPVEDLVALHQEADRRGLPFHMHVEEQPAEVKACEASYGVRPMTIVNAKLKVNSRFCAVHCTHTAAVDMEAFVGAGGNVCFCPLTEANLGDGIPNASRVLAARGRISLGSDCNARISFAEEMRWLEYGQRLRSGGRGVCVDESGNCARALWLSATVNGAKALGVSAGEIHRGAAADLIALDLKSPALAGWTPDTLLDSLVFGCGQEAIAATCVGGKWVGGNGAGAE